MVRIRTGINSNDPRDLNKEVSFGEDIDAALKMPTDLVNPTFMLRYTDGLENINYIHCKTWGRYYFVDNITFSAGGTIEFECSIDVLMSHKAEIEKLNVNITRQESYLSVDDKARYIADGNYCLSTKYQWSAEEFESQPLRESGSTVTRNFCLTVMGGQGIEFIPIYGEPEDWWTNWGTYFVLSNGIYQRVDNLTWETTPPSFESVVAAYGQVYMKIGSGNV